MGTCCTKDSACQPGEGSMLSPALRPVFAATVPLSPMEECAWKDKNGESLEAAYPDTGRLNPASYSKNPLHFCPLHHPLASRTYWDYKNLETSVMPEETDFCLVVFKRHTYAGNIRMRELVTNSDAQNFAKVIGQAVSLRLSLQSDIKTKFADTGHLSCIRALEKLEQESRK